MSMVTTCLPGRFENPSCVRKVMVSRGRLHWILVSFKANGLAASQVIPQPGPALRSSTEECNDKQAVEKCSVPIDGPYSTLFDDLLS